MTFTIRRASLFVPQMATAWSPATRGSWKALIHLNTFCRNFTKTRSLAVYDGGSHSLWSSIEDAQEPQRTSPAERETKRPQINSRSSRGDGIPYQFIYLKQDDNSLSDLVHKREVQEHLARTQGYTLEMIVEPQPGWNLEPFPICRIVSRKAKQEEEKAKGKEQRASRVVTKTMELSWSITSHDLSHKMKNMAKFFDNGHKVEVLIAPKRGVKVKPTMENAKEVLAEIRRLAEEKRAQEHKPQEGQLLKTLRLYFTGKKLEKQQGYEGEEQVSNGQDSSLLKE